MRTRIIKGRFTQAQVFRAFRLWQRRIQWLRTHIVRALRPRGVIIHRIPHQLTLKGIADACGMSIGTVRSKGEGAFRIWFDDEPKLRKFVKDFYPVRKKVPSLPSRRLGG